MSVRFPGFVMPDTEKYNKESRYNPNESLTALVFKIPAFEFFLIKSCKKYRDV